jgi:hypothetical protein
MIYTYPIYIVGSWILYLAPLMICFSYTSVCIAADDVTASERVHVDMVPVVLPEQMYGDKQPGIMSTIAFPLFGGHFTLPSFCEDYTMPYGEKREFCLDGSILRRMLLSIEAQLLDIRDMSRQ